MAKKGKKTGKKTGRKSAGKGKRRHGKICYTPCRTTTGKHAGRFAKC